jgi:hypothetical protein
MISIERLENERFVEEGMCPTSIIERNEISIFLKSTDTEKWGTKC